MSSGTQAAAHGGYTTVCAMPNLDPVPDSLPHLEQQLALIRRDAAIRVLPYGSITRGQLGEELSDMAAFSDDGRGVQSEAQMRLAMETAKGLHKLIVAHCEDNSLLHGGYIHDGAYARTHGHRGICSESEWGQIRRDLELVRQTGCGYHVCHISTKESVALIRRAKAEGLDVTCETAPHYLLMDETMLQEDGRFKMNPPLRSPADREALLEGLADGTIDMIATDHAPPQRRGEVPRAGEERHGHRGAGDRLPPAVYLSGKAGPALLPPFDGAAPRCSLPPLRPPAGGDRWPPRRFHGL